MKRLALLTYCLFYCFHYGFSKEMEKTTRAEWMEDQWGVRILLPGGDRPELYGTIASLADIKSVRIFSLDKE